MQENKKIQKFCNVLVLSFWLCLNHLTKSAVGNIVAADALTRYVYSVCGLKTAQMNIQRSLIRKFVLNTSKRGYNATGATKNK